MGEGPRGRCCAGLLEVQDATLWSLVLACHGAVGEAAVIDHSLQRPQADASDALGARRKRTYRPARILSSSASLRLKARSNSCFPSVARRRRFSNSAALENSAVRRSRSSVACAPMRVSVCASARAAPLTFPRPCSWSVLSHKGYSEYWRAGPARLLLELQGLLVARSLQRLDAVDERPHPFGLLLALALAAARHLIAKGDRGTAAHAK